MKEYKNTMLISPDSIKGLGDLNYNVDDNVVAAAIRTAQNVYMEDVLGTALLEKLQKLVYNDIVGQTPSIEEDECEPYKTLLDEYVSEALQYKAISEICVKISLKIRNVGVAQNSDTNINASSLSDIRYLRNTFETYYCDSLNRMMEYLKANKESFGEIDECPCGGKKPNINNRYANTGLYLGGK